MEEDNSLSRLQNLQRDLTAFSESRLANVARLEAELEASIGDLRKLLEKKRKNESSRKELDPPTTPKPETVKINGVVCNINEDFRQAALMVADELDLDELDAAKLCLDTQLTEVGQVDTRLPFMALLRYQDRRRALLSCLHLILQQGVELDGEGDVRFFRELSDKIVFGQDAPPPQRIARDYWHKCLDGLVEIEAALKKISDHTQTMMMTGQSLQGSMGEALAGQRILLTQQHESLAAVLTFLIRGNYVDEAGLRAFYSRAASADASMDIAIHYLPIIMSAAEYFGSNEHTAPLTSHNLHKLFAAGPGQQQWQLAGLKAAAIVAWLAEYSSRFADTLLDPAMRVADRQKAEQDRSDLFMQAVKDGAFHFMLAACKFLKPEVWHDPAKLGLVDFLLSDSQAVPTDAPPASEHFVALAMRELQCFAQAFVSNMPDVVRRLKVEEDDQRRLKFSISKNSMAPSEPNKYEPDIERFMVTMSYAYQDDADAAQDFWSDRDSNLYGFLRWASQRLPTPRVAAFCELLRSIASDTKSADQAHRFLLEDTTMISGKLRKTYNVSWTQIFAELDTYASSLKDRPAMPQSAAADGSGPGGQYIEGIETVIMLEAYLRLASHVCRMSPDARNWLLREQSFHVADVMFQLASSGIEGRIQASCFNMLSAMLTDKVQEVNDGMWVMLDNWIAAGGPAGSNVARVQAPGRAPMAERHYLQRFNDKPETASAFVTLLTGLVRPAPTLSGPAQDGLPFPENLGAPSRHGGIEAYVDFVVGTVFGQSQNLISSGTDLTEVCVLRYACLEFMFTCLSSFNEDLMLLANATNVAVDTVIKASSLKTYARLHPFARTMEWLFNNNVFRVLFSTADQDNDILDSVNAGSPLVQATMKSVQVMNLAMKMQSTYFDIVRPIVKTQSTSRSSPIANSALASFDEVMLSQLPVVVSIVGFAASKHTELSLESLSLLQKLAGSRKLSDAADLGSGRMRIGNRLVGALADNSDAISTELQPEFQIDEFDVESGEIPLKLVKAKATLDMLNSSLDAFAIRPTVAHCLLGFTCHERTLSMTKGSLFDLGASLFHVVAACAAQAPVAVAPNNLSWLMGVKRGCLDVILKLALSPLTSKMVIMELRTMDFLGAISKNQIPVAANPFWDGRPAAEPEGLLEPAALAIRDFLRVRESFFQYAALELRTAAEQRTYSVLNSAMSALLGVIRYPTSEQEPTMSVFDLFDFLDLSTAPALEVTGKYLSDLDLSVCIKDDPEIITSFDLKTAEELFVLRKRELIANSTIKDGSEEQQIDDEIRATLASLTSQNNWRAIQAARISALETWTDLLSLMLTSGGLEQADLTPLSLQALQTILPKFEKSLSDSLESAALLAKVTLSLVPAATASLARQTEQNAVGTHERLMYAFRVCLKTVTDSGTDLALRDVCYRTCCAVVDSMPLKVVNGKQSPSPHAKQLLHLVQTTGDRLMTVITEDAFSDRGSTRVAALLFLDALITLFQAARASTAILRALSKLNFVPVLIDTSIGSVASSFQDTNDDLTTTLAYFHTALALLLRICRTPDGTQLVLNSGFFTAISDSRLFSTDPDIGLDIDNPTALKEFYKLLSSVLRVITAIVICRGSSNAATLQQAKKFLQENRFSVMAVFKRTSAVQKTSGPPEKEAVEVAEEFGKLMLVTGFLEDDEPAYQRAQRVNGFT